MYFQAPRGLLTLTVISLIFKTTHDVVSMDGYAHLQPHLTPHGLQPCWHTCSLSTTRSMLYKVCMKF